MKKIIAMLLILCTVAICFASCAGKKNNNNGDNGNTTTNERQYLKKDFDFEGYVFKIATKGGEIGSHWASRSVSAEELNADPINDAVFVRNQAVCQAYNFEIEEIPLESNMISTLQTYLNIADEVDLVEASMRGGTANLEKEDLILNLHDPALTEMNLSNEWYDQNCINSLTVNGKLYAMTGDMIIMDDEATWVTLFNKQLAEKYEIPNLYAAVKEGKWTMDFLAECAAKITMNLEGSDEKMDVLDQWGMIGEMWNINICLVGADYPIAKIGADGKPEFACFTKDYSDAWQRCMDVLEGPDSLIAQDVKGFDSTWDALDDCFQSSRCLFNMTGLNRVAEFRSYTEMTADFGILPIPKLDAKQDGYRCTVKLNVTESIAIPKLSSDKVRTSAIVEALSEESHYTLVPAFYDTSLKNKKTRDDDSQDMLDLIFNSRVYDIGEYYDWGGVYSKVGDTLSTHSKLTAINKRKTAAETELKEYIEKTFA